MRASTFVPAAPAAPSATLGKRLAELLQGGIGTDVALRVGPDASDVEVGGGEGSVEVYTQVLCECCARTTL